MKKNAILLLIIPVTYLFACTNEASFKKAEDAQDAGREFIRASLDGDMRKANFYMLNDSANQMLFEKWKTDFYNKLNTEERVQYKNANILPLNIVTVNDSTVNYTYTNSYKNKDTTTIKVVRVNGEWLVDFKDIH